MQRRITLARALTTAALFAAAATRAYAQQATAVPSPAGADVIVIIPDSLANAPRTLSELLRDYVPSATVNRSTGALGASAFVSFRDASVIRGDDPLVVIDGIRQVSYRTHFDTLDRRAPSVLDDVMLDDVARVEVLNGPAAAANYGFDGLRGVIVVTTRRPGAGRPVVRASMTTSVADDDASFARNLSRVSADGTACPVFRETAGWCTATGTTRYTPLLDRSPFRPAQQLGARLGAIGGLGPLGYAASLGIERGTGTLTANAADRTAASLRLSMPVTGGVRIGLASFATERGIALPVEGSGSVLGAGIGGGPLDCSPATPCGADSTSGGYRVAPLAWLEPRGTHRRLGRLGSALTVDIDPATRLSLRTSVTADILRDRVARFDTTDTGLLSGAWRYASRERNWRVGAEQEARFTAGVGTAVATTRLSVRGDAERSGDNSTSSAVVVYNGLASGRSASAGAALFRNRLATSLDQRLAWGDRAALGIGAIRSVTAFRRAPHRPAVIDPHADAMLQLVPAAAPFGILNSFRIRTAYGQASGHDERLLSDPRFFLNSGGVIAIGFPPPPPPRYPPDRSIELEGGFDAGSSIADSRVSVTAFRRRETIQQLLPIVVATQDLDASVKRNVAGVEVIGETTPIDRAGARLHLRGQLALSHDRVEGVPLAQLWLRQELGFVLAAANGRSWGTWSTAGLGWTDGNADGRVDASELHTNSSYYESRQRSRPSRVASLSSDLEIAHAFTLAVLFDHVGGFDVYDQAGALQCGGGVCPALNDPNASLSDQLRAVAAGSRFSNVGFLVPGDATRLRELSLSYRALGAAALLHASSLRVTLSAYDLASWSRSKGVRPETDVPTPGVQDGSLWNVVQPVPRTVALRVALGY